MKKLNLLLAIFIGLSILSCSSDEDNSIQNPETESNFTINGTDFSIPNGYIFENGGFNNNEQTIFLLNGIVINNEWHGEACDYSNNLTNGIIFNEIISSTDGLQSGTYNYQPSQNDYTIEDLTVSRNIVVEDNCVISSNSITNDGQIISAALTVEKNGDNYILTFSIETNDFGTINGTYTGELQVLEDLS